MDLVRRVVWMLWMLPAFDGILTVEAATLTWSRLSAGNASGSWTNSANWTGGSLPTTGSDIVLFNSLDITADSTITLDGNQSVNSLLFGDTNSSTAAGWLIAPGTPAGSSLVLSGATPTISVTNLASGTAAVISAAITGTNGLKKTGTASLRLTGANSYSGATILSGSDCRISVGHDRAFSTGLVTVGEAAGAGQVWFHPAGARTLTNSFEIRTIRWIIDWNAVGGISAGDLVLNGPVLLNMGPSNVRDIFCGKNLTLNGPVTITPGSNPFNKQGGSTLTINGTNTFSGPTTVQDGTLIVNGRLASPGTVTVNAGKGVGGTGVIDGPVSLVGGSMRTGTSGGLLTVGGLTANSAASFALSFGAPNNPANGLIRVNGNLSLDGSLNISDLGGFTSGVYTGFWYSGSLTYNGLNISGAPPGQTVYVDTSVTNYILLRVLAGRQWPTAGEGVPMDMMTPANFSWVQVGGAAAYDLFIGAISNSVFAATTNTPGVYRGRTGALTNDISGLQPSTTYYWRVDGITGSGLPIKGAVQTFTTGNSMYDLMADTWVATDALNRTLPGHDACGWPRSDRPIGIFYFLWHTANGLGSDGPRDNNKEIERLGGYSDAHDPWGDNPLWMSGGNARSWYWGEPESGYYANDDEWVIRRHIAMLEAAGVDVLGFDSTNGHPDSHAPKYLKILAVIRKMRMEGTPVRLKVFHYTHADSPDTVTWLYDNFYKPGLYQELWFQWQGKPLIVGYPDGLSAADGAVSAEVRSFFTWRTGWAYVSGSLENEWQWIDRPTPQNFGWNGRSDIVEQLPVACGGWANGNLGRSHFNNTQPAYDQWHLSVGRTEGHGLLYREQSFYGAKYDPKFLWVVGWNEWWAGAWDAATYCYTRLLADCVPQGKRYFVDNYNIEYSRDIEPMKGGFTDNYYYQMVGYNRQRKGVRPVPLASAPKSINIGGDFNDWSDVGPEFRDIPGETQSRNHPTTFSNLPNYVDSTGRNDFTLSKVARDATYLYFMAECRSNITSYANSNWMVLLLNTDQQRNTGWEGYDYAINLGARGAAATSLSRNSTTTNGWTWTTLHSDLAWRVVGNRFMVRVPRSSLGLTNDPVAFDFHWADNFQTNDIAGFFLYGDTAPDRRFSYRYQASAGPAITLRQDSFDNGKQTWWDESWTNGSKWNLTTSSSYTGNSAALCSTANGTGQGALITRVDTSSLESLRLSFRYKLSNVLDAQNFNVQFLTATGWVTLQDLGRDEFHPAGQSWSYNERQNVWLQYTTARSKTGGDAVFFHKNFAVRVDGTAVSSAGQTAWVDDFLLTGVVAPTNRPLPVPWLAGDVGTTGIAGESEYFNGTFEVAGSGADIWSTADGFRFVYQPRGGDGVLTARITAQTATDIWAKAGVMIRESTEAGARHAFMALTPSNGVTFVRRVGTNSTSDSTTVLPVMVPPHWVRIVRSGANFTGFGSTNGTDWLQIGATAIMGFSSNALWGMAVSAHNNSRISTGSFDKVQLNQAPMIDPPAARDLIAGQTMIVTNTATDPDLPAQALSWRLASAPTHAVIQPVTGVITWRPLMSQARSTNQILFTAADDGSPSLSATQTLNVIVRAPPEPVLGSMALVGGQFTMSISGEFGPDYIVQSKTNLALSAWNTMLLTNPAAMPFLFRDPSASNSAQRYYRVLLGP